MDLAEKLRNLNQPQIVEQRTEHTVETKVEDIKIWARIASGQSDPVHQAPASSHRRRTSIFDESTTQEDLIADLDRARSRIQTHCIESEGHWSNDLWKAALRMLTMSRVIQKQSPKPSLPLASTAKPKPKQLIVRTLEIPAPPPKKTNPWGAPLAPKSANAHLSSRPKAPKNNSDSVKQSSSITTGFPKQSPQMEPSLESRQYKTSLPFGFSEDIWWRILGHAAGANGLLSPAQQRSVLRYGMDKGSLRKERDALGLKEALQIWHILHDVDCLAYEMR